MERALDDIIQHKYLWVDMREDHPLFISRIGAALEQSRTIKSLGFWFMNDDDRFVALFDALRRSKTLNQIMLSGTCRMGNKGAIAFSDFISTTETIETIGIWNNFNTPEGAIAVCRAIGKSKSLRNVNLDVQIDKVNTHEVIIPALVKAIKESNTIKTIWGDTSIFNDARILDARIDSDSCDLVFYFQKSIRMLRWLFEDYDEMMEEMCFLGVDFLSSYDDE